MKKICLYFIVLAACGSTTDSEQNLFDTSSSEPVLVGFGTISTSEFHESINYFDEDNKAIFFTRSDLKFNSSTIYVSYHKEGEWQVASKLPFSNSGYDAGFSFAPDRDFVFFTSKRNPNVRGLSEEWNIWKVGYDKNGNWSKQEVLEFPLNSEGLECCLTMNSKGQTFFSSDRAGSWDIYQAQFKDGRFYDIRLVDGSINSKEDEWPGTINEEGDLLLFSSIRKSGLGGDDLYLSRKSGETWSKPTMLDYPINSNSYEDSPVLTSDGKFLLFSSWREKANMKGLNNVYSVLFRDKEY